MEFANGGSFDHPHGGLWSKLAPFVILGPVPLLAKRSPAPSIERNLRRRPRTGKPAPSLRLAMNLRACRWWGSVFCLPLGLWLECLNAQMGPTNSNERKKTSTCANASEWDALFVPWAYCVR